MNERDLRKLYESTGGDAADYDSWKRSNKNIIQRLSNQNNSGGSDGSSGSGSDTTGGRRFGDALMDGITKILQGGLRQTSAPQGPNYLEQTLSSVFKQQKGGNLFEKMGTVLADLGTNAVADYAAEQSYLLTEVNEKLGLTGTLSEEFREEITKAQPALIRMGVPFDELVDSAKELVDTTGRFALVGSDMLVRAGEIAQAYGMDMTQIIGSYAEFERVGIGAAEAQESIANAGERSLELGLQSKTTIKGMMDNIGTLNQYGFQNGVEGLEKMVRRSTEVRMELSNVFKVAENVFDPEGALDLSANLQVLGAAFGDFNDPLRLMYMATNEVEGLQGAIEGVSKNLATYNSETGAFEVTGANLRQARDIAKTLGMEVKDLTQTAIAQQERMQASQMMAGLGLSEEQERFLTNIARMKDGKMSIELTSPKLQEEFAGATAISLDKIDQSVANTLLQYQDEFKDMTEGELVRRQATAVENINRDVNYLVTLARLDAAGIADNQIEKLVGIDAKDTGQSLSDIIGKSTDDLVKLFGYEDVAVIREIQDKLGTTEQIRQQEERRRQVEGTTTQTTTTVKHEHNVRTDQTMGLFQKEFARNPEQWILDNSRSYTSNN